MVSERITNISSQINRPKTASRFSSSEFYHYPFQTLNAHADITITAAHISSTRSNPPITRFLPGCSSVTCSRNRANTASGIRRLINTNAMGKSMASSSRPRTGMKSGMISTGESRYATSRNSRNRT